MDGLSFSLARGECLALLGANGAGKTTTIRMLYGFQTQEEGEIVYEGKNFSENKSTIKRMLGVCTQEDNLDHDFTVRRNMEIYASYFNLSKNEVQLRINELLELVELKEKENSDIRELSGGMKKRLQIVRTLLHKPTALFLDEPTTGLDPEARRSVWEVINRLKEKENLAIILTTHYMDEAEKLSDKIILIKNGKKILEGSWLNLEREYFRDKILVTQSDIEIERWATSHNIQFFKILDEIHIDASVTQREMFFTNFPETVAGVRPPTLEDLYMKVSAISIK